MYILSYTFQHFLTLYIFLRWKSYMEDTKVFQDSFGEDKNKCYFGLFDGYHGRFAADMAAAELHHLLLNEMAKFDPKTKSTTATNILDTTDVEQVSFSLSLSGLLI